MKTTIMITWHCHVCMKERPENKIATFHAHSEDRTIRASMRYCIDDKKCKETAIQRALYVVAPSDIETVGSN